MSGFHQVTIATKLDGVGNLLDLFDNLGALSVTQTNAGEDEYYDLASPGKPLWQKQYVTALFAEEQSGALGFLQETSDHFNSYRYEWIADEDWQRRCLSAFSGFPVGLNLYISPSWQPAPETERTILQIDPGLAFGTGTHATTQLCLRYLSDHVTGKDLTSVLDFGCGSGILAIAALLLGAQQAVGVDVDDKAIESSVQNALVNDVDERYATCSLAALDQQQFQLVFANILAGTLIELVDTLGQLCAPGGLILLSGILQEQAQQVIAAYAEYFEFSQFDEENWVLLVGKRHD